MVLRASRAISESMEIREVWAATPYQQNGASAQHARPHHEQGQERSQSILLLATSFEFGICVHPHFSCDEDGID
jgi:hypothetical protein